MCYILCCFVFGTGALQEVKLSIPYPVFGIIV